MAAEQESRDVPLLRRLVALLIDWIIAALAAGLFTGVSYPPENIGQNLIITAFFFGQITVLEGLLGYSIGKRITGLRVERPGGAPVGLLRAALRTALLCTVLPAVVMTEDKRGLHDLAAGSRVTWL